MYKLTLNNVKKHLKNVVLTCTRICRRNICQSTESDRLAFSCRFAGDLCFGKRISQEIENVNLLTNNTFSIVYKTQHTVNEIARAFFSQLTSTALSIPSDTTCMVYEGKHQIVLCK